jgi:hypothetical protein
MYCYNILYMNPYEGRGRDGDRGRDRGRGRDGDRGRGRDGDGDRGRKQTRDRGSSTKPPGDPDRSRSRYRDEQEDNTYPHNPCQTYFRPSDLLIYQTMRNVGIHNNDIQVLNYCTNILQQQILDTDSLQPTNKSQMDPCKQKNLFCIEKEIKNKGRTETTIEKNKGTIRAIGLFKKSDIQSAIRSASETGASRFNPEGVMLNKLTSSDDSYKFAIASFEGNPNGVLGMCLCSAVSELNPRDLGSLNKATTISNESRGATEQLFVEDKLDSFMRKIQQSGKKTPAKIEEALISITKTYGPLVNKGLSDISQAGELAKYYILKYIEAKRMSTNEDPTIHCDPSDSTGENFWNITSGLPSLVAFSSDAIASVLGVRIQKSFKGQFQSILPRKHGKGRYSVVYIPYEYISLMIMLHNNTPLDIRSENIKQTFTNKINLLEQKYNFSFATSDYFSDNFFNSLRALVDNIYIMFKRYGQRVGHIDIGFSKSIIDIIDNMFIPYINSYDVTTSQVSLELHDLINTARDFKNIFGQLYLNKGSLGIDSYTNTKESIKDSFDVIKKVLLAFGELIQLLKDYVTLNKQQLIVQASQLFLQGPGYKDYLELPGWTGILYSTISYYDNCCDFKTKTSDELLQLYLNISVTEESCAEQDVDYGHDQAAHHAVQKLGVMVARDWFVKAEPIRTSLSTSNQGSKIHEENFSKLLIDMEHYFSVALTYNTTGNPILRINITQDPNIDFIYNTTYSSPIASGSVINIRPIGNIETWGSIDYTIGDPFINITKSGIGNIQNEEKYYKQFIKYFEEENIIEIRTPTTDFDAAAPSGCLYKTTEKMCVSYREFIPDIGRSIVQEKYLFVILTLNLNDDSKNNLNLSEGKCFAETTPLNIFDTDTGKGIQRADTITELQTQFSRPLTQGTELQKEKLYGQKIRTLIQDCYNIPETGFKTFLKSHVDKGDLNTLLYGIDKELESLNKILTGTKQKGSKGDAEKLFKQTAPRTFKEIIKNIGKYCSRCQQDINCGDDKKIVIKELLKRMYSCMFGQQITGEIERIMLSLDKLVEREEERIGISAASALLTLADSNSELDEEVSDDDVIMGEDSVPSTTQIAYAANLTAEEESDDEDDFLFFTDVQKAAPNKDMDLQPISKAAVINFDFFKEPNIRYNVNSRLEKLYGISYGVADNLYEYTKEYHQDTGRNISEEDEETQLSMVIQIIEELLNPGSVEKTGKPLFQRRGGKRKTIKNKIYKNKGKKWNTKRTANKKVRKTKKRHIKGKRITRRR